ncbi:MAG: hypothetical protein ABW044_00020 [Cellvibrio sp.]
MLQLFPQDIVNELGELIRTLNSLVGPLNSDALKGLQEPNGYSGITRRSNYHRLLASEWVLLDIYQDEFLRRAVSGEHLFHQLEHVEPKAAKTSYVLFDCGPTQLGKPRVVQLALLILLARRAEKVKANFYWGVLQDPHRIWNQSIDVSSIKRWLNLRSVSLACNSDINFWINNQNDPLQDLWIISPEKIDAEAPVKKISINAILFDDKRLKVNVSGKAPKKEMIVDLPSLAVQTKILRDPFTATSHTQIDVDWNYHFGWHLSPNGSLLAYMGQKNAIISVRLPGTNNNKKFVYRDRFIIPAGCNLAGVYVTRKRMCVAYCDKTHIHLYNYPDIGKIKTIELTQSSLPNQRLDAILLTNDAKHKTALLLLDAKKSLRKLALNGGDFLLSTVAKDVIYFSHVDNCQFYVCYEREQSRIALTWLPQNGWPQQATFAVESLQLPSCFAHGSRPWTKNHMGMFAYEFNANTWKIASGSGKVVSVDPAQKIVGVLFLNDWSFNDGTTKNDIPCLVAIEEDNFNVSLLFEDTRYKLLKLPSKFIRGELNCMRPLLHYVNDSAENITVCLKTGSELLRLHSGVNENAD